MRDGLSNSRALAGTAGAARTAGEERGLKSATSCSRSVTALPLIAIIEGEAVILDAPGNEIIRHGPSGFLGESNLLSGQTVYLTAVVTQPMRYIAVEREELKSLLFEDGPLSDLLLSTFIARREGLQSREGVGMDIIGPQSSDATRRMVEFARRNRLPATWMDTSHAENAAALALIEGSVTTSCRSCGFQAGRSCAS